MTDEQLRFRIALSLLDGIGDMTARTLVSYCGGVEQIFKTPKSKLLKIPGIGPKLAEKVSSFSQWKEVERETEFIRKKNIHTWFYLDKNYPSRLRELPDSPALLFGTGKMNPENKKVVAIVGTRKATDYGVSFTKNLVEGLQSQNILIVSGLAYGIDVAAHKAAINCGLETIAVVAHGLNQIYPKVHTNIARQMAEHGGIISDYHSQSKMRPENFPARNRIIAGLCDAIVVVESSQKGGALITAAVADSYNRDVFAVPGPVGSPQSVGCNLLIKRMKASLIESAEDLLNAMNWGAVSKNEQPKLLIDLTADEQKVADLLKRDTPTHIDTLVTSLQWTSTRIAATLLEMEFKGALRSLPGSMYKLV